MADNIGRQNEVLSKDSTRSTINNQKKSHELLAGILNELKKLNSFFEIESEAATARHNELMNLLTTPQVTETEQILQNDELSPINKEECDSQQLISNYYKSWKEDLQRRERAFCSYWKNQERSRIYEQYLTLSPPYIPPKCREKAVRGQNSTEWTSLHESREVANTKHEILKLQMFSRAGKAKMDEIDEKMSVQLAQLLPQSQETIREKWKSECAALEEKIKRQWTRNKVYLETLPCTSPRLPSSEVIPKTYHEEKSRLQNKDRQMSSSVRHGGCKKRRNEWVKSRLDTRHDFTYVQRRSPPKHDTRRSYKERDLNVYRAGWEKNSRQTRSFYQSPPVNPAKDSCNRVAKTTESLHVQEQYEVYNDEEDLIT